MLSIKEKSIMLYIIEHCKRIEEKIIGATRETLDTNKDIEEIICFNILQIGELAKNLTPEFISKHPEVPWNDIKGMRDVVAHGYGTIILNRVWQTAIDDVKPLREYCEQILKVNDWWFEMNLSPSQINSGDFY